MNVNGIPYRTIWLKQDDPYTVMIIDQRKLPHQFVIEEINSLHQMEVAIKDMHLRGAGLIGAAAAYGMYLATLEITDFNNSSVALSVAADMLKKTRPTAVNLAWAVDQQLQALNQATSVEELQTIARNNAVTIADDDLPPLSNSYWLLVTYLYPLNSQRIARPSSPPDAKNVPN